jgi:arylsulfatase
MIAPTRRALLHAPLAMAAGCVSPNPLAVRRPPDIVIVLADDLGWSDLGAYGSEISTPNLDALAAQGLRHNRFYNTSKCYTTRASLLTGVYQHEAGIGGLISRADRPLTTGPYQGYLDPGVPTLAEMLRPAGYRSHLVGKWHVGERPQHWPLQRGFDTSFGLISGATSYFELTQEEGRIRTMVRNDQPWTPPAAGYYATDAYSDEAARAVAAHARATPDQPMFLYLAYTAPHWPLHAPEERVARWLPVYRAGWDRIHADRSYRIRTSGLVTGAPSPRPEDIAAWDVTEDQETWARRMAVHAAMVEIMDEGVGRVVESLRRHGRWDNCIVLFLSDNGASAEDITARGLHGADSVIGRRESYDAIRAPWAWAANAPFRGVKETVFEGGLNTPCVLYASHPWFSAGALQSTPAHVVDIVPTLLQAAGLDPASRPSTAPALRGRPLQGLGGQAETERPLFFEIFESRALIRGRWKALRHRGDAQWSLFDLATDPREAHDLSAAAPARLEALQAEWLETARAVGVRRVEEG